MPFLSFLYQFLIGGAIFLTGILLSWKSGGYAWANAENRRTLIFILGGYVFYLVFQGLWFLFAAGR